MRSYRILALATLVAALMSTTVGAHDCMHDHPSFVAHREHLEASNPKILVDYGVAARSSGRIFHPKAAQPIRIAFDTTALSTTGKYCTAIGDVVSAMDGSTTISCTLASEVLTQGKINILMNNILPAAVARLQQYISVQPVTSNIKVPSTGSCGSAWPIPAAHTTTGVANADLVIYVAAAPISGTTAAFAGACTSDTNGRAVVGFLNFDPEGIAWTDGTTTADKSLIDVASHEMTHVLGVSGTKFASSGNLTTMTKRGKTVSMVTTPAVTDFARRYTGCAALTGVEIEDEGSSGSAGSHWERKLYMDEIMCAVSANSYSGLTLAWLHDLNVGYTVAAQGENMYFGHSWGCGIHDNLCTTTAGGAGKFYCTGTADSCTPTFLGIGKCYPAQSFMDGCGVVRAYSNYQCSATVTSTGNDVIIGNVFKAASRCYGNTGTVQNGYTITPDYRCHESRCVDGALQVKVGTSDWLACPTGGSVSIPTSSGFKGTITCSDNALVCSTYDATLGSLGAIGGGTTQAPGNPPPAPPVTPAPTPVVTTTNAAGVTTGVPSSEDIASPKPSSVAFDLNRASLALIVSCAAIGSVLMC